MYPQDILEITDALRSQVPGQAAWHAVLEHIRAIESELGIDPSSSYASVVARLANFDAVVAGMATSILDGLLVTPGSTVANVCDITIGAVAVGDPTNGYAILQNVQGSCDANVQQLNGRSDATRNPTGFYHLWVGQNPSTGGVGFIWDDSPTRAGLTLSHGTLSGYTRWRRIGSRQNVTSAFLRATTVDRWTIYDVLESASRVVGPDAAGSTTPATVSLSGFVPTTSRRARVLGRMSQPNISAHLIVRPAGGAGETFLAVCTPSDFDNAYGEVDTDSSQQIQWYTNTIISTGVNLSVKAYYDSLLMQ